MTDKINERDRSRPPGHETAPNHIMVSPARESNNSNSDRDENNRTSSTSCNDSIPSNDKISSAESTTTAAGNTPVLNVQGERNDDATSSQGNGALTGRAASLAALRKHQVRPGQVLNPRGRPKKDYDLAAMAQKHAEKAIQTLAQCLDDETATWPARVSAASELLDRGFGRAPQSLNVDHKLDFSASFEAFVRELGDKRAGRKTIEHDIEDIE